MDNLRQFATCLCGLARDPLAWLKIGAFVLVIGGLAHAVAETYQIRAKQREIMAEVRANGAKLDRLEARIVGVHPVAEAPHGAP